MLRIIEITIKGSARAGKTRAANSIKLPLAADGWHVIYYELGKRTRAADILKAASAGHENIAVIREVMADV